MTGPVRPFWLQSESLHPVVLSTRYRLARNLTGLPFPARANPNDRFEVTQRVRQAVSHEFPHWRLDRAHEMAPLMRELFFEMHLISAQILGHPEGAMVCTSKEARAVILVNEEDHLRLQLLLPGFQMEGPLEEILDIEGRLERWLDFAFHPQYGYLTSCLSNVGTGLRASVMMHVPALSWHGQLRQLLDLWPDSSIEFRGLFGEGSSLETSFIQLSNKVTLGADLAAINHHIALTAKALVEREMAARELLLRHHRMQLEDAVYRSFATLSSARLMTTEEASAHLSMVRLGACLEILTEIPQAEALRLLIENRPAHLQAHAGRLLAPEERDVWRAAQLRSRFQSYVEKRRDG